MSKSALTTLNRLLGKKNKDKAAQPNGKFSKSSSNLSISTTNLNETSQLEYNRITPLPIVTSNAPFEQTFRITVLLPKDQLYVCRLGARVPLSKLLELVCENKLLDPEKYEFRNPVDASQVYDCELTIGAVGLSEIRLCSKSESYDNFNADEMIKLQRTTIIRDSLSSSEFSSRNSKSQITTKTPSPYSSSNSLNSMDSTGMNYTRTPVVPTAKVQQQQQQQANLTRQISNISTNSAKIAAPPRKKRAAPRPPSQMVIPEKSTLDLTDAKDVDQTIENLKNSNSTATLPRKDYFVSTPNLVSAQNSAMDCNGNVKLNGESEEQSALVDQQQIEQMNARNLYSASVQDLSNVKLPEPSPRKRIVQEKKKKSSAPAPPPRGSAVYSDNEDAMSIASTATSFSENLSTAPATPQTPIAQATPELKPQLVVPTDSEHNTEQQPQPSPTPMKRETVVSTTTTTTINSSSSTASTATKETVLNVSSSKTSTTSITASPPTNEQLSVEMPKPVPRQTSTTLLNATPTNDIVTSTETITKQRNVNVSKVMLNRTPTPEPRSLSTEPSSELDLEDDDNRSKQADSGIGEPVPSPIPDSLPSEGSAHECKSTFESSSDDDDIVKVYNFKLCKTVKPLGEHKTLEDLSQLTADDVSGQSSPVTLVPESKSTPSSSDTTSWNFSIPISPPPNFADISQKSGETGSRADSEDAPIQPKIKERPVLNFESLNTNSLERKTTKRTLPVAVASATRTPMPSPATPINEIVDELSTIISENRMDSLIKQSKAQPEIESAKQNTLSNFSIGAISQHSTQQHFKTTTVETFASSTVLRTSGSPGTTPTSEDDSKLYRKRGSITNLTSLQQQRKSLTRADSFQQPTATSREDTKEGLNSRSSSHLCLTKIEQNGLQNSKRRSSSELSIGESPSLQSLEIIKTILNSRKNSLANSGSDNETKESTKLASPVRETVTAAAKRIETATETRAERIETEAVKTAEPSKIVEPLERSETAEPKDLPKTYRYSGPPSINFSTWSERPKVQVAIKNEGDYIFGGQQLANKSATTETTKTMPRNYRVSTPAGTFNFNAQNDIKKPASPPIAPKPDSTTARMGIPEKEFKVPITVKPLADVIVTTNQQQIAKTKSEMNTSSAKVEYNISKQNSIATLPRNFGNKRFSTPVTSATTLTTQASVKAEVPGPSLLRSRSINKAETESDRRVTVAYGGSVTATATTSETSAVPFGQGTLRRTGLKEKILAKEQQEKAAAPTESAEKQVNTATSQEQSATLPNSFKTTLRVNSPQSPSQSSSSSIVLTNGYGYASSTTATLKTTTSTSTSTKSTTSLQSANKFELKLQENSSAKPGPTNIEFKQEKTLQSPKSAPVLEATPTPPPPPSSMAAIKLKSIKSMPNPSSSSKTVDGDPHDALLAAIRNFKKDNLNRV